LLLFTVDVKQRNFSCN